MKRHLLAALALSLLCATAVHAQTHPNVEKGFAADKMYQLGDFDQVNVFNGNLSLTIPIGGTTPVSDHLALPLTLVYNTKLWSAKPKPFCPSPDNCATSLFYTPERRSNAGFGWTLTPGRLIDPLETDINNDAPRFLYQSPDGSDRLFYDTLHEHGAGVTPEPTSSGVLYSRDSTYLRLSAGGAGEVLESPDGTVREFESFTDTIPNNTCTTPPCPAYTRWRLKKIRDRFGNHIDIDYNTTEQWRITDQYGRLTVVHFSQRASDVDAEYLEQISSIDVPAAGGGTATYSFSYQDKWVMTGSCATAHPDTPVGYKVPLLMSVTLPDGTSYAFTYTGPIADSLGGLVDNGHACRAGGMESATLPTKGSISYVYQEYELPVSPCNDDPMTISPGIKTRVTHDPFYPANDQTWDYTQSFTFLNGTTLCPGPIHVDDGASEYINTVTVSTADGVQQKTRYYFSVYHGKTADANGTTPQDYGLPFSRIHPFDSGKTRFLSTEILTPSDEPKRSTYLRYAYDPRKTLNDQFNARVTGTRTVFLDDDEAASNALGKHYVDTEYDTSTFDGVGHFRTKTTSGDLFGSPRSVTTAYNTIDSLVNPNALATGNYDAGPTGGSFIPPPLNADWVLNLYPTVTTSETGTPAVQEACFNKTTGFLNGTRVRGGAGRAATDLIAAFGSDTASAGGMAGAVTSEKFYGGDVFPLTASLTQSLCDTLAGTPGPLGYDIRHSYLRGVRATSEYYKNGATVGFKFLDRADTVVNAQTVFGIDPSTGLTMHSRDSALVETSFTYDTSRRSLTVKSGDDPVINYVYTNPTSSAGAHVTISQISATSGSPEATFDYDGFGRLVLQSRSLPALTPGGPRRFARQKTVYDAMGHKTKVSEWEESSSPSHFTISSGFDLFGRPGTVTRPDNTTTTLSYQGAREIDRTSHIHTVSGLPDTDSITKEIYDVHGRLHEVREHNNNTTTTYSYDVGGRLQSAATTGDGVTQTRSFTYDNRGFLGSETHPEIGISGNGTTLYSQYDARGHALSKTTGTANGTFDLRFVFDESERLKDVYDNGGTRHLKHFDFATENAGSNKQQGKLTQAVRFNHLTAGDITVTETYKYEKPSGRTSSRETLIANGTTTLQDFQQLFDYDDLGSITAPGYPTCLTGATCGGTTGLAGATYTYRDGSLISVPNYASISYLGNMISQVDHQNGVSDVYRQDSTNGMPRPASIAFQNVTTCSIQPAPVITANSPVCAGSTGNTASVPANANVQYQWFITGGAIVGSTTANTITYTAGGAGTLTLSVTATDSCGTSPAGTRNVTVATGPTATLTVTGPTSITRGSSTTLHVALTGTQPWTVTWSDMPSQPQTVSGSFDRTVFPQTTTTYSITAVSDGSAAPCNTGAASGGVTINVQMPAPTFLVTSLDANNSRIVHLIWSAVSGATYRLERSTCLGCGWSPIPGTIGTNSTDYVADPTTLPSAALYHVIAMANGTADSPPSPYDYATTATVLFAEPIGSNGVTRIKGAHVQELRRAIDELRRAANRPPAWTDYSAPTGLIFANDALAMRTALDEAVFQLTGAHMTFPGETPAHGGLIFAYQFTQLRTGVK